jgi:hypothetical protein
MAKEMLGCWNCGLGGVLLPLAGVEVCNLCFKELTPGDVLEVLEASDGRHPDPFENVGGLVIARDGQHE